MKMLDCPHCGGPGLLWVGGSLSLVLCRDDCLGNSVDEVVAVMRWNRRAIRV